MFSNSRANLIFIIQRFNIQHFTVIVLDKTKLCLPFSGNKKIKLRIPIQYLTINKGTTTLNTKEHNSKTLTNTGHTRQMQLKHLWLNIASIEGYYTSA